MTDTDRRQATPPAPADEYWGSLVAQVKRERAEASLEEIPLRSTAFSTTYGVRLLGIGRYPLFAYYSVPHGDGPFPAIFQAPGYGSVVAVPAYERRRHFAVLALCHRGQRLSDSHYAAAYPGLLTDGVEDPASYRWREIVADCLSAADFLAGRPEVDAARMMAAGNDLALITAALGPAMRAVLLSGMIFRDTYHRLPGVRDYPLEEFNDYLRTYPDRAEAVRSTLALFDPIRFAGQVTATVLVRCSEDDRQHAEPLIRTLEGRARIEPTCGRGRVDHHLDEEWLAAQADA